jgi:hypothetical protein
VASRGEETRREGRARRRRRRGWMGRGGGSEEALALVDGGYWVGFDCFSLLGQIRNPHGPSHVDGIFGALPFGLAHISPWPISWS